jgi:MbtH protein
MTNPFEDDTAAYLALLNDEGQYSLWPAAVAVPAGWTVVHGEDTRQGCRDYIERNWADMRPRSLIAAIEPTQPRPPSQPD